MCVCAAASQSVSRSFANSKVSALSALIHQLVVYSLRSFMEQEMEGERRVGRGEGGKRERGGIDCFYTHSQMQIPIENGATIIDRVSVAASVYQQGDLAINDASRI